MNKRLLPLLIAASFGPAAADPTHPVVVSGQATFSQQGNVFSITNTPNTIINWQSFSIAPGEVTRFIQQGADSAVLNRILGQDPSQILGALQSNGHVFLINPNGIMFGKDARIDVNGLTASTLNLSNADFLAGKRNFGGNAGAGAIKNEGTINAGSNVFLIASSVENSGIITSPKGDVVLAAGHTVQLVDSNNPDLHVVVSAPENKAVNLGQVIAQGGRIGIYGALVNQRGTLNANSAVVGANGKIVLKASGDTILEAGSVTTATGAGTGGDVHLLGQRVGLTGDAQVDASGAAGGGTVLVGGDYQGKNAAVPNARQTYMGTDVSIRANATQAGGGGKIVAWADDSTQFYGSAQARGAGAGQGGQVETSGRRLLDVAGARVDAGAASGRNGSWLLDPTDITVVHGSSNSLTAGVFAPSSSNSIGDTQINSTLSGGTDVTLQTSGGKITVNGAQDSGGAVSITNTGGTRTLTLSASSGIYVNSGASITGDASNPLALKLTAPSTTLDGATIGGGTVTPSGAIYTTNGLTLADATTLNMGSNYLYMGGSGGTQALSTAGTATINLNGAYVRAGYSASGQTLNIGSGITIQGSGGVTDYNAATINNAGTLIGNSSSGTFYVNPNTFNNTGTVRVVSGSLQLNPVNYTSSGTFDVQGGALNFYPSTTVAGLGTVLHTAGTFNYYGTLDNTASSSSATLDLGATGPFGAKGLNTLGGTIYGGYIGSSDGTVLGGGTLDGVTVKGPLTLGNSVYIKNGLALSNGAVLDLAGYNLLFYGAGTQNVSTGGTATVNLGGGYLRAGYDQSGQTLAIGSGVTVQGSGGVTDYNSGSVSNAGTLIGNSSSGTFYINPHGFTNTGTVSVTSGYLQVNPTTYTNSGTLDVQGGTLNFYPSGTVASLGTMLHSGGAFNYWGTLDNSASGASTPLDIGSTGPFGAKGLTALNGTISGGYLASLDGTALPGGTLDGVTLAGTVGLSSQLFIKNGLTLAPGATLNMAGNSVLFYGGGTQNLATSGTATVNLGGGYLRAGYDQSGQTLAIGSGITVQGSGAVTDYNTGSISNAGTIIANSSSGTLYVDPGVFTNTGTVRVTSGYLQVNPTTYTNSGTFDVQGGTLNFYPSGTAASLGTVLHSGGAFNYYGTLNNSASSAGSPLDLGGTGPFGAKGLTALNGTITGGYVTSTDATPLTGGTLDGVTLSGTVTLGGQIYAKNNLTLAAGATLNAGTYNVYFNGSQNLTSPGSATINLGGGYLRASYGTSGETLTIGSGITIQGNGGVTDYNAGTITNAGTIIGNSASGYFYVDPHTLNNSGTIRLASGTMQVNPAAYANTGTVDVQGGTMQFYPSASVAGLGTILHSGGSLNYWGTLDNSASTAQVPLDLGATGPFGAAGLTGLYGKISGGYIGSSDGTKLSGGTVDGVTVTGNLQLGGQTVVTNGLTLANGASLDLQQSSLLFSGASQSISTPGTATISSAGGYLKAGYGTANTTLTIGSGLTLQGYGGINDYNAATVVNNGTVIGNVAQNYFYIDPTNFTNNGTVRVAAGTLELHPGGTFANNGTLDVQSSGTMNFYPSGTVAQLGALTHTAGTFNYEGTLTNSASSAAAPLDIGHTGPFGSAGLNGFSKIVGGYLTSTDTTQLPAGGTLDGVTLVGAVTAAGSNYINSGLTLYNGATFDLGGNSLYIYGAGTQTLGTTGTATLKMNGGALYAGYSSTGQVFDIGSGVTVSGRGVLGNWNTATIVNDGTITADSVGNWLSINPSAFTNNGTVRAAGGNLDYHPVTVTNNGTLDVQSGAFTYELSGTPASIGTVLHSGGAFIYAGQMDNTASGASTPLDIGGGGRFGTLGLSQLTGSIVGGYVSSNGTASTDGGTWDGLTFLGSPTLTGNAYFQNSTGLAGGATLTLNNGTVWVRGTGTQNIAGVGTVQLNNANLYAGANQSGQTLVIGNGITVQGSGSISQYYTADLVNNGTIATVGSSDSLSVNTHTLTNNGTLRAGGGALHAYAFTANDGTIDTAQSAVFYTGASLVNNGTISGAGTVDLGGNTLTNNGALVPGGSGAVGTLTINGALASGSTGSISAEVGPSGSTYDKVVFSGAAALGGTLNIAATGGYTPANSDQYNLMTYNGAATGSFATVSASAFVGGSVDTSTSGLLKFKMPLGGTVNIWNYDGNGLWTDATKWSLGHVPTATEDVQIPDYLSQFTINVSSGGQTVHSILLAGNDHLSVSGGTLTLTNPSSFSAGYIDLSSTGVLTTNGGLSVKGLSLSGSGLLSVASGQQVNINDLVMTGGSIGGTGNVQVSNSYARSGGGFAASLTGLSINQASGNLAPGAITIGGPLKLSSGTGNVDVDNVLNATTVAISAQQGAVTTSGGGTITATKLAIRANNGIGAGTPLSTTVGQIQLVNAGAGNIAVNDNSGALTVSDVIGSTGIGVSAAGGSVALTSTGSLATTVPVAAAGGNVSLGGTSLSLGGAVTATGGAVALTASGAIGGTGLVSGNTLNASAGAGINHLYTSVGTLTASNSGATTDLVIQNSGPLTIAALSQAGSGMLTLDNTGAVTVSGPVASGSGDIALRAHSPLTVNGSVTSTSGNVTLEAGSSGASTDTLTIGSAGVVSTGGTVTLRAGSGVTLATGSSVTAASVVTQANLNGGSTTPPAPQPPSMTTCIEDPTVAGCSAVLPTLATCESTPTAPGCSVVLPSLATCTADASVAGCGAVLPTLAACTVAPSTAGCAAVLPTLATCTTAPATAGCTAVLPTLATCTIAPSTAGCAAVLPTLATCTIAPSTAGCTAVLPTLGTCTSAPSTAGCSAVLPTLATCTSAPSTAGCSAVLPTLTTCTAAPATAGCSAVLPTLASCTAAPATAGCSAVLPTLAACTAAPATAGCGAVLPTIATCSAAPSTAGCSAVLPTLAACVANPAALGCNAVLPTLASCIASPLTAGCTAVLPSLAQCVAAPGTAGCTVVLPGLDSCVANPTAAGCEVVLPSLSECVLHPAQKGCGDVLPTLAECTTSPSLPGCQAVLPSLAQCAANSALPGCGAVLPTPAQCAASPGATGCPAVTPAADKPESKPIVVALNETVNVSNSAVANISKPDVAPPPAPAPAAAAGGGSSNGASSTSSSSSSPESKPEDKKTDQKDSAAPADNATAKPPQAVKTYCN